jgi:hypothetical protein
MNYLKFSPMELGPTPTPPFLSLGTTGTGFWFFRKPGDEKKKKTVKGRFLTGMVQGGGKGRYLMRLDLL